MITKNGTVFALTNAMMTLYSQILALLALLILNLAPASSFARPVPEDGRAERHATRSYGSFEVAKMSDSAKTLIRDCIEDTELSLTPRRCVNLIKSIIESQKGALGASLMLKTCRRQVNSRRACEHLVEKVIGLATKPTQTAYAAQSDDSESGAAR